MTNHWTDVANANLVLIIGANPAENHPASYTHILRAQSNGGKIVVLDPRFTRSAAKADMYAPIRSGTDIAVVGAIINYVVNDIEANPAKYNMTYLTEYTNAPTLINPDFKGPADLDGLFSGYNAETRSYTKTTWSYQLDSAGVPIKDKTLKNPNSVFQLLKKHYSRYTFAKANEVSGIPVDKLQEIAKLVAATGAPNKAMTIMYAMGATQHTYGTQLIRTYCILQLLLGNVGLAGGGINALRGESNVQGATDWGILFHLLPGYLPAPTEADTTLAAYNTRTAVVKREPRSLNWWSNRPKYIASLLKTWYGDNGTVANDFGFNWLPKMDTGANHSFIPLFKNMYEGKIKGLMIWGQNPVVSGPNQQQIVGGMEKLDWVIAADLWENESANFWKRPGANPANIKTEVFLLPAAASFEKEGSVANSSRWMQWRYKAVEPPGEAMPDLDIINKLMLKLRELYNAEGGPNADAITKLAWNYGTHVDPHQVAKEDNGYDLKTGKLIGNFTLLLTDGTTSCGNWIYSGSYNETGNLSARRDLDDGPFNIGLNAKYAWSWPLNRRIIYNRASVDLDGKPFNPDKPVVKWNDTTKAWEGDIIDGGSGPLNQGGWLPFIMQAEGVGSLFGPGLTDGPFPEHYEPWESPVSNVLSKQQDNPVFKIWEGGLDVKGSAAEFPIACTTFRVVEHWQAGAMSRNLPWLVEMVPSPYVEISETLAAEKGIAAGDIIKVSSARGSVELPAMVTKRVQAFNLGGKTIHQVAIPWHWGWAGLGTGASANVLSPNAGDANTTIPESKAFLVKIEKTDKTAEMLKLGHRSVPIEPLPLKRGM